MKTMLFATLVVLGSVIIKTADSECCKHACCGNFRCCGVGRCNIFCCNCDGGICRSCTQTFFETIHGVFSCIGCPVGLKRGSIKLCKKCVTAGRRRRDVSYARDRDARSIMNEADENQDGFMDVIEAADFLAADKKLHIDEVKRVRRNADDLPDWFLQMDLNRDGLIELHELDSSA